MTIKNKVSKVLGLTLRYRHLSTYIWRKMFFRPQIWLTPHLSRSAWLTEKISIKKKNRTLLFKKEMCWSIFVYELKKIVPLSFINSEIFHWDPPLALLWPEQLPSPYYLAPPQKFRRNFRLSWAAVIVSLFIKQIQSHLIDL